MDITYWDKRYELGDTAWDAGKITTPLKEYIDHLDNKNQRILIPGCGNGYEAEYLAVSGFADITVIDISSILTESLRKKFSQGTTSIIKILQGDFFGLNGEFDLILEQTFFCALEPRERTRYVQQCFNLLAAGGRLAGVLFNRSFEVGPPFGGNEAEYRQLFSPRFELEILEPCYNSIKPRAGSELFIQFRKRSV